MSRDKKLRKMAKIKGKTNFEIFPDMIDIYIYSYIVYMHIREREKERGREKTAKSAF